MKKIKANEFYQLSFWRRNPDSVESIDQLFIERKDKDFLLLVLQNGTVKKNILSKEDVDSILTRLYDDCKIQFTREEYTAYRYEDNRDDFSLKFFLVLEEKNFTYLAIKGIHPFKQDHYQDILHLFDSYFSK